MKKINLPLEESQIEALKAGEEVLLSGYIYTARDKTHLRLMKDFDLRKKPAGSKKIPLDLKGQIVYYTGPTPASPGRVIGSCGPTTSGRMDAFAEPLLRYGVKAMIGKGRRSEEVRQAIKKYKAVYFLTVAGAGAYLSKRVIEAQPVLYKDLGAEALYRLKVKDFPVIVAIDSRGNSIY
ncbi:MAG: FumA C-terminus/TtdB family hydratase beta subunit [Candidatus Omnitrophota bacterium]